LLITQEGSMINKKKFKKNVYKIRFKTIYLFFNIISITLDTYFPTVNKFSHPITNEIRPSLLFIERSSQCFQYRGNSSHKRDSHPEIWSVKLSLQKTSFWISWFAVNQNAGTVCFAFVLDSLLFNDPWTTCDTVFIVIR